MGCGRPFPVFLGKHRWSAHRSVRAASKARQIRYLAERSAQFVEFHSSFDLWHGFVQDIKQVLAQLFLEGFVICTTMVYRFILPLFKPFPQTVGDENAIAHTRETSVPLSIFGAWETHIYCVAMKVLARSTT